MCFLHITHNRLQKRNRLLVKLRKKSTRIKYRLPVACYTFLIFIIIINFIHKFSINLQNIIKAVEWVSCLNLLRASYKRYINQFIATWDECKLECGWMWIRARIFWWTMSFCTLKNKTLSKVKKITIIQHDVYKIIKLKNNVIFVDYDEFMRSYCKVKTDHAWQFGNIFRLSQRAVLYSIIMLVVNYFKGSLTATATSRFI